MKDNGTDRDIALQIADRLSDIDTLIETINDNLYVPHITEQPTDSTTAINAQAVFTVVADHVKSYQWQYKATEEAATWTNLGGTSTEASMTIKVYEDRYAWRIRCDITGLNGQVIYTDTVKIIQPE